MISNSPQTVGVEQKPALLADYLRPEEVARALGVSVRTLSRWTALRQGPPRIKIGRQTLFAATSLRRWLTSLEQSPSQSESRQRH